MVPCNRLVVNYDDAHGKCASRAHIMAVKLSHYPNGTGTSVVDRRGEEATSDQPCQLGLDWWMGIHAALLET